MMMRRRRTITLTFRPIAITLAMMTTHVVHADVDQEPKQQQQQQQQPQQRDPIADEARARFARGIELFDEGDYKLALIELDRAYKILPSYKILYNLGQVHFQLGEYARAHATLVRYLADGGDEIPTPRRREVEADLAALVKRIAALTVEANVSGVDIMFDDQTIGTAPIARTLVDAGSIRVIASKPGYVTKTRVVTLAGGDELVVRFELAKAMPDVPSSNDSGGLSRIEIGSWIATGILTAGAIGTGIATSAAASRFDTMREAPIQGSGAQAKADLDRQGNLVDALALTTDVLIVTAILTGGISLYLTLGRPRSRASSSSSPSSPSSPSSSGTPFALSF